MGAYRIGCCGKCLFGVTVGRGVVVCRRGPPVPVLTPGENFGPGDTMLGFWPRVASEDSCGEFKPDVPD